jgi:hypothetical protein
MIEKLYCVVGVEEDGSEGIMASGQIGGTLMPLVTSRPHLIPLQVEKAEAIFAALERKPSFRVLEFSARRDITGEYT